MLGGELQQPTNYLVEILSPVSSIEKSETNVVIAEPILVCVFDKDSKIVVVLSLSSIDYLHINIL